MMTPSFVVATWILKIFTPFVIRFCSMAVGYIGLPVEQVNTFLAAKNMLCFPAVINPQQNQQ
jgi:hypothetical protein